MEKQSLLTRVPTVRSLHRTRLTTGTALWLGLLTMLWAQNYLQRTAPEPSIEMVPPSSQTLTAILQQNYDHKLAAITAALSEGTLLPTTEQAGIIRHTIQPDDTLWRLTRMYQVDAAAITISNGIDSQTPLNAGDVLLVPRREGLVHRVASGETLEAIANRYQARQADIIQATPLTNRDFLRAGQTILIPGPIPRLLAARNGEPLPPVIATAPTTEADPADTATAVSELPTDTATEAPSETEAVIAALSAAESAPRAAATLPPTVHVVRTGDTLEEIAIANSLTVTELRSLNPNIDPRTLQLGQELITAAGSATTAAPGTTTVEAAVSIVIPPERHAIQSGDTLETIAITYGMTIAELQRLNPSANPRNLQLGQELIVTGTPQVAAAAPVPIAPPVAIEAPPAPSVEVPVVEAPVAEIPSAEIPSTEISVVETPVVETVETPVAEIVVAEPAPEPLAEAETSPATEAPAEAPITEVPVIEVLAPAAVTLAALPEPEIETSETEAAIEVATPVEPVAEIAIEPEPEPIAAALPPLAVPLPPRDPSAPPLPLVAPLTRPEVLLEPEDSTAEAEAPTSDLAPLAVPLPPPNPESTPLPLVAALPPPPPPPTPDVTIEPPPPEVPPISEGFVWPVDGVITSGFGWRWNRIHAGVDIPGPVGSPIVAVQSGTVIFAGWHDGGYGLMVEIRHDDRMVTRYAHGNEVFVSVGQTVTQGQTIMSRGSTGWSTGPHLHLEVLINGQAVDPVTFLP